METASKRVVVCDSNSNIVTRGQAASSAAVGGVTRGTGAPVRACGNTARCFITKTSPPAVQMIPAPASGDISATIHRALAGSRRQTGGRASDGCAIRRSIRQPSA